MVFTFVILNLLFQVQIHFCSIVNKPDALKACAHCGAYALYSPHNDTAIWDGQHLTTEHVLCNNYSKSDCVLVNFCEKAPEICKGDGNRSTGVCYPLFGTFQCQCNPGFFGQRCELKEKPLFYNSSTGDSSLHAVVNNIVFTPTFNSSDGAKIYVSLLAKGTNLEVLCDNGRGEELIYSDKKCRSEFIQEDIIKFCTDLFTKAENIRLCEGMYSYEKRPFTKDSCLIVLNIPYPSTYNSLPSSSKFETFMVSIYNRIGSVHNHPILQQKFKMLNIFNILGANNKCLPHIKLLNCGSSMKNMPRISRFRPLIIISSFELVNLDNDCKRFDNINKIWRVWRIDKNHDELKDLPMYEFYQKDVYPVEEESLQYGIYKIKLTVTALSHAYVLPSSAYCYFEVIHTPIQTFILGGSIRHVYYKRNIEFKIVTSIVPDRYEPSNKLRIIYTWRCNDTNEYFCRPLQYSKMSRVIIGPFKPTKTYNFTLKTVIIDKFSNMIIDQNFEYQVVSIISVPEPDLTVICLVNCGGTIYRSNPQEIIHLQVLLDFKNIELEAESQQFHWTFKLEDSETEEIDGIRESNTSGNMLTVKKNVLLEGKKYDFMVADLLKSSSSKLVLQTSTFPRNVSCVVVPDTGTAGDTFFNINCTYEESYDDFSVTYEFYNRDDDDIPGRLLGISVTGLLEGIVLTRKQISVRTVNFFGATFETLIPVQLHKPKKDITILSLKFGVHHFHNYIYRVGLISAYGDLVRSRPFRFQAVNLLLEKLAAEDVRHVTGALLLENVLNNIVCKIPFIRGDYETENKIILNTAKVMFRISLTLKEHVLTTHKNSRYITLSRMMNISKSIVDCLNTVIEVQQTYTAAGCGATDNHLKSTSRWIMKSLDDIITGLAFKFFPLENAIRFTYTYMEITISDALANKQVKKSLPTFTSLSSILEKFNRYYIQRVSFDRNPFRWCNGYTINTNVIYSKLGSFHRTVNYVARFEKTIRFNFDLDIKNFTSSKVSGTVKQPDPNDSPQVNDFMVAVHRIVPRVNSVTYIKFTNLKINTVLRILMLHNRRPDFDYMTLNSSSAANQEELIFTSAAPNTFYYLGILPGIDVKIGESVNYSFELFSATCKVFRYGIWMSGNRCGVVKPTNTTRLFCSCLMPMLTIGGQVYIPQNDFNPFSDVSLFVEIKEYPFIIVCVLILLALYGISLVWTVRKDKTDKNNIKVVVLEDNDPRDRFGYLVAVFTGCRILAGTTSNVGIRLFGEEGVSRTHLISTTDRPTLDANSDKWFLLFSPHHLGALTNIKLWLYYAGERPNWYCSKIFVCDMNTYETDTFIIEKWFGVTMDNILLKYMTECATYKETNEISRIFSENMLYGFRENHVYASIFLRHPRSFVTRSQRLTVVTCGLFVQMLVSILLYCDYSPLLEDFALYTITTETVVIGLSGSLVGILTCCVLMGCFKSCFTISRCPSRYHEHSDCEDMYHFKRQITMVTVEQPTWLKLVWRNITHYVRPCKLIPVQSDSVLAGIRISKRQIGYSWLFCLIVMVLSIHTTVIYSFRFSKVKTLLWLTSFLISIIQTVFILLPVTIMLTAFLLSITKTRYYQLMSHNIGIHHILGKLKLKLSVEFEDYLIERRSHRVYKSPLLPEKLTLLMKQRSERVTWSFFYGASYLLSLIVVVWFIETLELKIFFHLNSAICNDIKMYKSCKIVQSIKSNFMHQFLENLDKVVLPALYREKWYNNKSVTHQEEPFQRFKLLKNGESRLLAVPRIRQFRVKKGYCKIPNVMSNISPVCQMTTLTPETEDRADYSTGWASDDWTGTSFDEIFKTPWIYRDPTKGKGSDVVSPSGQRCHFGGYTVSLHQNLSKSQEKIRTLSDTHWIDNYTRVVIMEFISYNGNTNIFTFTSFITESLHVDTFTSGFQNYSITFSGFTLSGAILIIFFVVECTRMLFLINIMGLRNYFKYFWNWIETIIVVVWLLPCVFYVMYVAEAVKLHEDLSRHRENMYCDVGILTTHFSSAKNGMALLFFLVVFRFVRIIRLNSDVRQYIHDLCAAGKEILWTLIVIMLFMLIQWRFIMYLLVPPNVSGLKDVLILHSVFKNSMGQMHNTMGKILAFCLIFTSQIGMFSFIVSLTHYYKKEEKAMRTSLRSSVGKMTLKPTRPTHLWYSTFD